MLTKGDNPHADDSDDDDEGARSHDAWMINHRVVRNWPPDFKS
jgi:hypothetical protein